MPLLLKKIGEDLEHLKKSLHIVRENPEYMAKQFLSNGIQNMSSDVFEEVNSFLICCFLPRNLLSGIQLFQKS